MQPDNRRAMGGPTHPPNRNTFLRKIESVALFEPTEAERAISLDPMKVAEKLRSAGWAGQDVDGIMSESARRDEQRAGDLHTHTADQGRTRCSGRARSWS